jgi:hypothetical protein
LYCAHFWHKSLLFLILKRTGGNLPVIRRLAMAEKLWTNAANSAKIRPFSASTNRKNPMELKVVCYCGQKYKFDAEPTDGRMPHAVNCPVCGVDGTPLANQLITQRLTSSAPPPVPAMAVPVPALAAPAMAMPVPAIAAPAAATPVAVTAPAPIGNGGGLRINIHRAAPAPPPLGTASVPPPLSSSRPAAPGIKPLMSKPIDSPKEFSMGLGILGAFLGAFIGTAFVFGFTFLTGFRFPLTATLIGVLTGYGARWLARGTDMTLGVIAGGLALLSAVGIFFLLYGAFAIFGILAILICGYLAYQIASG